MMTDEQGYSPKVLEKQHLIANQTRKLNEFYNPKDLYVKLDSMDGSSKPLDMLAKQENEKLGIHNCKINIDKMVQNNEIDQNEKSRLYNEWFERHYELENLKNQYPQKSNEIGRAQSGVKTQYEGALEK
jgi:hypothetical protein